jgi:hypothetical protein
MTTAQIEQIRARKVLFDDLELVEEGFSNHFLEPNQKPSLKSEKAISCPPSWQA